MTYVISRWWFIVTKSSFHKPREIMPHGRLVTKRKINKSGVWYKEQLIYSLRPTKDVTLVGRYGILGDFILCVKWIEKI